MVKYICTNCGKQFNQKSHHDKHMNRITKCENKEKLIEDLINKKVSEKVKELVPQFGELSEKLTKKLKTNVKKTQGIFFTPNNIIKKSVDLVIEYCCDNNIIIENILEPSCGSCEFIKYLNNVYNNVNIDGIEYNDDIYDEIEKINFGNCNSVEIINEDYLQYDTNNEMKYDLIIGNPPYFVIPKKIVDKKYDKIYDGRPNIYLMFIMHSLLKLNENGILLFILPKSFCNCLWYNKLRVIINNNYSIIHLIECYDEKYIDTEQETIIFMVQNKKSKNIDNVYINDEIVLYNTLSNIKVIKSLNDNSTTLHKLNFEVSIGKLDWTTQKNKSILTTDKSKTRVIYDSNIVNKELVLTEFKNPEKKNYINKIGKSNPVIIINRGYGNGKYKFKYCILDIDQEYILENHVIQIEYKDKIDKKDLLTKYQKIIDSFNNPKTKEFIDIYCCNNALNGQELEYILPIY